MMFRNILTKWRRFLRRFFGCCPNKGEALGQHLFLILTQLTYPIHPYKTKHTCELVAVAQVQAGEFHALEHHDVAWGSGDGGKAWGEMKKVPGKVLQTRPWGNTLSYQ